MNAPTGLTSLQLELLKVFSMPISEAQLLEIRVLLSNYFAEKATAEMDRLWDEKGWSQETMHEWANEKMRKKA